MFIALRVMWLNRAPRQLGPCGFTETYICRMWAILLGCILREAHCNNREGERRDSEVEEEGKEEEERGGGGSKNSTFTIALRAIMPYCRRVYGMCRTINNQFMGTWWKDKRCACCITCLPFGPYTWPWQVVSTLLSRDALSSLLL